MALGNLPMAPPPDPTQCEYEALNLQDDTYEQVDQPLPPPGDYQLTTCEAYVPTGVTMDTK